MAATQGTFDSLIAVGIIVNPASGKDIRRLVAYGSEFDNRKCSGRI